MFELLREKLDSEALTLAKEILGVDPHILEVKIIHENGEIEATASKPGENNRFDFDKNTNEQWGTWSIITIGLLGQFDKVLSETEYVTIGRKNYKAMLIPISSSSLKILIGLVLERSVETNLINDKVRALLSKNKA